MAVTIREMKRRLDTAIGALDGDVEVIVKMLEQEIIDLNREKNLSEGIGTDGNILGVYSKATEEMTQGITGTGYPKRAGDPFNFYDTGDMFKSFSLKIGKDSFSIFNTSQSLKEFSKTKNIDEGRIIGLTEKDKDYVNFKRIRPILIDFITRHINGL